MADGLMSNPFVGLLSSGLSPEQAQAAVDEQRALQFANMNPQQRMASGIYKGITGLGRALGVKDPMLEQASKLREMASQFDTTTAEGMMQYAQALQKMGNIPAAQQAALQARQMMVQEATLGKTRAEQAKAVAGEQEILARANRTARQNELEDSLRNDLAKLPEDATEDDYLRVVRRYGDPDKILSSIERKAASRYKVDSDAELQRERLAQQERLAQMQAELRRDIAASAAAAKASNSKMPNPTASDRNRLAVARDTILQTEGTIEQIEKYEDLISKGELSFSFLGNLASDAMIAAGISKPKDVNKKDFDRFVLGAANALLLQAKGTQTEGDAQRARDQVVGALAKNDTKAVQSALKDLRATIERTRKGAELTIEDFNESFGTSKPVPGRSKDTFVTGKIYEDKNGNRAKYLGKGKWENI